MIKITDIAFTGTPVTDMKRARAFYEGVLGLVPSHVFEFEGTSWIEYDVGAAKNTLAITDGAADWKPAAGGTSVTFEVENMEAALKDLKAKGVAVPDAPMDTPVCQIAIISDPDGNSIALHACKNK